MSKKVLIDAAIQEETRLVILQGQKIETFETETQNDIKGNIYLARITRVEPSLQAAFIDYGGNRHGFLAFPDIHPDYFQIPIADREAPSVPAAAPTPAPEEGEVATAPEPATAVDAIEDLLPASQGDDYFYNVDKIEGQNGENSENDDSENTQTVSSTNSASRANNKLYKKYSIQDVIKSGQVLLVQIVKEERGNKGAALTTFMSLAGRYCVLMPNTESAGGVSRKLAQETRNKIRSLVDGLEVPDGMSLIVRTAGAQQPKTDVERDFEYLMRLWDSIRELTLESVAPTLVYEEGDLVQRTLRDFVKKDTTAIYVEGAGAYEKAKQYMEKLTPQLLPILHEHKEVKPLFVHYGVEDMLDEMLQPTVQLKSGGYIVINPTEALVAVDVNSGKATSEHNIEDTALKTNLEAADEVARQARLRDLAGLIVIDFIDMEKAANIRDVEKRLRDAVRSDRARVQTGRISTSFGLLEMSRQRLSSEISEKRTDSCPECSGSGQVLSPQTIALRALREGIAFANRAGKNREVILRLNWPVVLYLLNERKDELLRIEQEQGIKLCIEAGGIDNPNKPWALETRKIAAPQTEEVRESAAVNMETAYQQMTTPEPGSYDAEPIGGSGGGGGGGDRQKPRGRSRHRQQRRNNNNNNNNNNNFQNKKQHSGGSGGGSGGGGGNRQHAKKDRFNNNKPAKQADKPSILQKLFGKKK